MTTGTAEKLDAEELLHLAIGASNAGNHEESITLLKRALIVAPKNARVHYLLGAEHAQIGLYERAAQEMQEAVKLDPELYTAHFQLGLLHITSGRPDNARSAWQAIDKLGDKNPLFQFKTGLLHLAADEFQSATEHLNKGLQLNRNNEALNRDMRRILADIEKLTKPSQAPDTKPAASKKAEQHVLLDAYRQNRQDEGE